MIIFSLQSRFNSRSGSASMKGTKARLDKLGVIYMPISPGSWIWFGYAKDRTEYEHIKRTLCLYAGCKFPITVESADGSLTYRTYEDSQLVRVKVPENFLAKIQGQM